METKRRNPLSLQGWLWNRFWYIGGSYKIVDPTRDKVAAYHRENVTGCRQAWKTKTETRNYGGLAQASSERGPQISRGHGLLCTTAR